MKLLCEISEKTLGIGDPEQLGTQYELRKSARAILLNEKGQMATQYLNTYTFHKLPGGGVDPGETIESALRREVAEEVGCAMDVTGEIGMVIEFRNKYNLLHLSYCFTGTVRGEVGTPELEDAEVEEGMETLWLPPKEVLERMRSDTPGKFEGHFIRAREIAFLEAYLAHTQ